MEAETQERSPDEGALPSLCLKQVYPKYTKQFNYLRLVERIAALFIRFLGVKGNMRLGPTAFRTFIRYEFYSFILWDPHQLLLQQLLIFLHVKKMRLISIQHNQIDDNTKLSVISGNCSYYHI